MKKTNKTNKFSPEVRERAVGLVQEHRGEYPSLWAAVESIAPKIGCVPQTIGVGQARGGRCRCVAGCDHVRGAAYQGT